jgi:hypothetical protein
MSAKFTAETVKIASFGSATADEVPAPPGTPDGRLVAVTGAGHRDVAKEAVSLAADLSCAGPCVRRLSVAPRREPQPRSR